MHDNAALIAGGSIAAARAVAYGEVQRAVNFCGGLHHAMADSASGFCVYNDAALTAIRALLDAGIRKVAYIDIDAHHGDGVQAAFYDNPRVPTVSLHQTALSLFPGTGFPAELGQGAAQGTSVNVAIDGQRTSYVALRDLAETVTDGRWVALGGGGYSPVRVVPRAWTHLLGIVAGRDLDTARTIPENLGRAGRQSPAGRRVADRHEHEGTTGLVSFPRWEGAVEMTVDRAITDTRNMLYPLHGLDPQNPRD